MELLNMSESVQLAVITEFLKGGLPLDETCCRLEIPKSTLYPPPVTEQISTEQVLQLAEISRAIYLFK
jgi:hypothetical protein